MTRRLDPVRPRRDCNEAPPWAQRLLWSPTVFGRITDLGLSHGFGERTDRLRHAAIRVEVLSPPIDPPAADEVRVGRRSHYHHSVRPDNSADAPAADHVIE